MIVRMRKTEIILQAKDTEQAAVALRRMGVLHVEPAQAPQGSDISALGEEINLVNQAMGTLTEFSVKGSRGDGYIEKSDWHLVARHIVNLKKRIEQLKEYSVTIKDKIDQWKEWGDFDPREIEALKEKNIYLKIYQIPLKEIDKLPAGIIVRQVSLSAGLANCVVISKQETPLAYKEMDLPKMSLSQMQARLADDAKTINALKKDILKHLDYQPRLSVIKKGLDKELELHQVMRGMGDYGTLACLSGYLPADAERALLETAKKQGWGVAINEPSEDDNVPTLIRNPRWAALIQPVLKFLEIVPGYRELDISPLFLCFLGLFFGMIIGDAGYGVFYFALTFLLQKKFSSRIKDKKVFSLFYFFSACAILWGLLTGTFFGQEWHIKAGLKPILPILNDTKFLQAFCFFLGAFHLTLAHAWQAMRKTPSLTALADSGWICVLWAAFFLAKNLILNDPLPYFTKWLIIAGISLVIFFSSPQKNILKTIASGLGAVALSLVNNFTDVVSYVRLFAVGMAGLAIAETVNTLAAGFKSANPLAAMAIIFIGHTINMLLGPMSVLVHGVRLNILEFSGHANLAWSGVAYKPLKE